MVKLINGFCVSDIICGYFSDFFDTLTVNDIILINSIKIRLLNKTINETNNLYNDIIIFLYTLN